jgi:hypothetical protein
MPEEVKGVANYAARNSQFNALSFMMRQAIREQVNTCVICKVVGVSGGYVDVLPLVSQISGKGEAVPPATLFHLPFMRYHAGSAAVILNPVVGDLGLAVFSTKDNSGVKQGTAEPVPPASFRGNTMANGFYIGGFLNAEPTTFIELGQNGQITITAPGGVAINGDVTVTGDVTAGSVSLKNHTHTDSVGGVTSPPL